jgi:hypothetical protein
MKNATTYLRLLLISAIIVFNTKNGFAQTEKFLKLNRIINIDSTKTVTNAVPSLPDGSRLVFDITVPNGVFWKINLITGSVTNPGNSFYIGIGKNSYTPVAFYNINNLPAGTFIPSISTTQAFWLSENEKIRFIHFLNSGIAKIFVSAEEYILGQ